MQKALQDLRKEVPRGHLSQVKAIVRLRVVLFIVLDIHKELLRPKFLKEAQQGGLESLSISGWDLVDLRITRDS